MQIKFYLSKEDGEVTLDLRSCEQSDSGFYSIKSFNVVQVRHSDLQSLYNLFLNVLKESSIGTSCGLYPGRNIKSIFELFMVFAACFAQ